MKGMGTLMIWKWKWWVQATCVLVFVVVLVNLFRNPWWIALLRGFLASILFSLIGFGVNWFLSKNGMLEKVDETLAGHEEMKDEERLKDERQLVGVNGIPQEAAGKGQFVDFRSGAEQETEDFRPWIVEKTPEGDAELPDAYSRVKNDKRENESKENES